MTRQKFIPKVSFILAPLNLESKLFYGFLKSKNWIKSFYRAYPEVETIIRESKNDSELEIMTNKFVERTIKEHEQKLLKAVESIQKGWDVVGSNFLTELSEHFGTEWSMDKEVIIGNVSILPVFPRFLDSYSFCVGGFLKTSQAVETSAHEIVHFLWFKKWKEVFPEIPRVEYERPHLTWRLSEVMVQIILQCNPKIKELIKPVSWGYESFKELKIGEVGMTNYFAEIYKDCLGSGKKFDETLKILWEEAQRHKSVLEKF